MLVDLNKEEINYIVNVLNLNNAQILDKEETQFKVSLTLLTEIAIGFIILLFAKCHD